MTSDGQEYCAGIPATGGSVLWSDFALECWGEGGLAYDGGRIEAIMVVIASEGPDGADITYDICVTDLAET
jgi:hypothetical protein